MRRPAAFCRIFAVATTFAILSIVTAPAFAQERFDLRDWSREKIEDSSDIVAMWAERWIAATDRGVGWWMPGTVVSHERGEISDEALCAGVAARDETAFDVLAVAPPPVLPGFCAVTGIASRVWQGDAYRAGQPLLLKVPCAEYGLVPANVRMDGIVPVNVHSLQQSAHGIARLSADGALLWQDFGRKNYGPWGQVAGYRVLDPRMLPVMPS